MSNLKEKLLTLHKAVFEAAHDCHETGKDLDEVLSDFTRGVLDDMARAECINCRRGNVPTVLPYRRGLYAHRVREGKNGGLINMPCRATEIRKLMAEIPGPEGSK